MRQKRYLDGRYMTDEMTSSGQPHNPRESSFLMSRQASVKAGQTEPLDTDTVMAIVVEALLDDCSCEHRLS